MAYTRAGMKAVDKYVKENYTKLNIKIPKAQGDNVKAYAKAKWKSVNAMVNELIRREMGVSVEDWKDKSAGDADEE